MKNVFFQWWEGPSGRTFTTLHLHQNGATKFRRETSTRKRKGTWKSTLHSKIGNREVSDEVYGYIATRLHGRSGIRANVSDFTSHEMV